MARKGEPADTLSRPPVTEADVLTYLRANPSFLTGHLDLVSHMTPPSRFSGGPVSDLQYYMIERLNEELEQMRGCAEHLIATSRSNMSTQNRTHEAALAALAADGLPGLTRTVADDFATLLDVDVVTLGFESGDGITPMLPGVTALPPGLVEKLLGEADVMLRSAAQADPLVFGAGSGLVKSFALVRIAPRNGPLGLLAMGSRAERAFHASQGTDLLAFLGNVVEDCVRRWWPAV